MPSSWSLSKLSILFPGWVCLTLCLGSSTPPSWAALGLSPRYKETQGTGGQVPWKDPETAEEGTKEGACTTCWVSERGYRAPGPRNQDGSRLCKLPPVAQSQYPVQLLGTCTSLHIEGCTDHPFKEYLLTPHYVLVQDSRTSSVKTKLQ